MSEARPSPDGAARGLRELQVTPMPDTIEAPGLGFLPLCLPPPQSPGAALPDLRARWHA